MDLAKLKTELTNDPLSRGYSTMNDEAASKSLNVRNRTAPRELLTSGELVASLVGVELSALGAAAKDLIRVYASAGDMPMTAALKNELSSMFPPGTQTRANLVALLTRAGSRAEELELGGLVTPSHVADARRL